MYADHDVTELEEGVVFHVVGQGQAIFERKSIEFNA